MKKFLSYIIILFAVVASLFGLQMGDSNFSFDSLLGSDEFEVHFIDVGQGDSTLVITPDKKTMLIDAGTKESSKVLIDYLKNIGINSIDVFVLTHPHSDHIGGAVDVMENFEVKQVLDSGFVHTSLTYEKYLDKIDEKNIPFQVVKAGDKFSVGDMKAFILSPDKPQDDANNSSIVMRVTYKDFSCMFTGDVEEKIEEKIIKSYPNIRSVCLKVAHHGSDTSSSKAFLEAVRPEVSVIHVGADNAYGHPSEIILKRLKNIGTKVYRTDLDGTIIIKSDGSDYSIESSK